MAFAIAEDAVTRAFQNLGNEWALLAAGNESKSNAMTVSWGSLGFIWQRPVVMAMVRPQRYTYEFTEAEELFSLSFYGREYRKALSVMGTRSGRDGDKVAEAGLTPCLIDGVPGFKEAYLTVIVRKLYRGKLEEAGFLSKAIGAEFYPEKDYHTLYFGEVVKTVGRP